VIGRQIGPEQKEWNREMLKGDKDRLQARCKQGKRRQVHAMNEELDEPVSEQHGKCHGWFDVYHVHGDEKKT
jgi:hypothetical protein